MSYSYFSFFISFKFCSVISFLCKILPSYITKINSTQLKFCCQFTGSKEKFFQTQKLVTARKTTNKTFLVIWYWPTGYVFPRKCSYYYLSSNKLTCVHLDETPNDEVQNGTKFNKKTPRESRYSQLLTNISLRNQTTLKPDFSNHLPLTTTFPGTDNIYLKDWLPVISDHLLNAISNLIFKP